MPMLNSIRRLPQSLRNPPAPPVRMDTRHDPSQSLVLDLLLVLQTRAFVIRREGI